MEYYSAIKNEILPFATTKMDPEGIKLTELSQRKTNTISFHLHVLSKKINEEKGKKTQTLKIQTLGTDGSQRGSG